MNKNEKKDKVFSNIEIEDYSQKLFFDVYISEEITKRIKCDSNYYRCLGRYPNAHIDKAAAVTVDVTDGIPFLLRSANKPFNTNDSIMGKIYVVPLFTTEELGLLSKMAKDIRRKNKNQNQ